MTDRILHMKLDLIAEKLGAYEVAEVTSVVRRQHENDDGQVTDVIDFYPEPNWVWGFGRYGVGLEYLNEPWQVDRFEKHAGVKVADLPVYQSATPLQRKQGKEYDVEVKLPRSFKLILVKPDGADDDSKKKRIRAYLPGRQLRTQLQPQPQPRQEERRERPKAPRPVPRNDAPASPPPPDPGPTPDTAPTQAGNGDSPESAFYWAMTNELKVLDKPERIERARRTLCPGDFLPELADIYKQVLLEYEGKFVDLRAGDATIKEAHELATGRAEVLYERLSFDALESAAPPEDEEE